MTIAEPTIADAEEYARHLSQQIADLERVAWEDLQQYDEEHAQRRRDRMDRLYHEAKPLRKMFEALVKELSFIKGLDPVLAQGIVSREASETHLAARPEGQEPGPKDAP